MKVIDVNVEDYGHIIAPLKLKSIVPINENLKNFVIENRKIIQDIIYGKDNRKLLIIGPCSIHDTESALEYAKKLSELSIKVKDRFVILMRTYFEKPRTTIGWKGLINDPNLDGSYDINNGLNIARTLLIEITKIGVPCATEYLEPITPQFFDDLISYVGIGARTTESPTHRQLASGLSMPVGFKNATSGDVNVAINAVKAANHGQAFLGMDELGRVSNVKTSGNKYCHVILRGGKKPNFDSESINETIKKLEEMGLCKKVVVDCSHANSNKDYINQPNVFKEVINQIKQNNDNIIGLMIESNLKEGNQKIPNNLKGFNKSNLKEGVSITDACIDWDTTEKIVIEAYEMLK